MVFGEKNLQTREELAHNVLEYMQLMDDAFKVPKSDEKRHRDAWSAAYQKRREVREAAHSILFNVKH